MINDKNNLLGKELNPFAKSYFTEFFTKIETELFCDIKINCVYDSCQKGMVLYKEDNRNPIVSFHTFGIAVDLNIIKDSRVYLKSDSISNWQSTGVPKLASDLNIRWGGLFKGYQDCVHFDLAAILMKKYNINDVYKLLDVLKTMAIKQFGNNWINEDLFNITL
jgi:hypothetical protein